MKFTGFLILVFALWAVAFKSELFAEVLFHYKLICESLFISVVVFKIEEFPSSISEILYEIETCYDHASLRMKLFNVIIQDPQDLFSLKVDLALECEFR